MNIVVAVRCFNEERHVNRFINGYSFADKIVISDGGSTDRSVELIKNHPLYESKIQLLNFDHHVVVNGHRWNEDAPPPHELRVGCGKGIETKVAYL